MACYVKIFNTDGTAVLFALSDAEYDALALPGAGAPPRKTTSLSAAEYEALGKPGESSKTPTTIVQIATLTPKQWSDLWLAKRVSAVTGYERPVMIAFRT